MSKEFSFNILFYEFDDDEYNCLIVQGTIIIIIIIKE